MADEVRTNEVAAAPEGKTRQAWTPPVLESAELDKSTGAQVKQVNQEGPNSLS